MASHNLEKKEAIEKLTELVEEVKICMFATIHEDYSVYSRPMQTIKADEHGSLWFFTNEYSEKVHDVSKDNTVYLMFSHPGQNTYVHVKGTCSIVDDKDKMKELWSPVVKAWFPKGIEDPALALMRVDTIEASYWDGSSSKLVTFFDTVKALATGEKPKGDEFGKLEVK